MTRTGPVMTDRAIQRTELYSVETEDVRFAIESWFMAFDSKEESVTRIALCWTKGEDELERGNVVLLSPLRAREVAHVLFDEAHRIMHG